MHRPFVSQLLCSGHLSSRPRSQQHSPRAILARPNRSFCECRTTSLDTVHTDHVLISVRETC